MLQRLARNLTSRHSDGERASSERVAEPSAAQASSRGTTTTLTRRGESKSQRVVLSSSGVASRPEAAAAAAAKEATSEARAEAKEEGCSGLSSGLSGSPLGDCSAEGSSEHYKMPELEKWVEERGCGEFAGACIDVCARARRRDVENYGAGELAKMCQALGFSSEWAETYGKLFEDNTLDGWVFLEIVDWEDYGEIGVKREHAVALCAVAKGVRGDFGYAIPRESRGVRRRVRLTDEEEQALREADEVAEETGEGAVYGQLVVLGYKEYRVEGSTWHPVGPRNEKFELRRRKHANGIRRANAYLQATDPKDPGGAAKKKRSSEASHSVTMSVAGSRTADGKVTGAQRVTVEYVPDAREDMFQLGRMIVPQNDFVVRGPLHLDAGGVLCGPVSRYACRLACSRLAPFQCTLYAAGFNNERDIFLSEMAPKWQLEPGEVAADDPRGQEAARARALDARATAAELEPATTKAPRRRLDSGDASDDPVAQWDALTTFGVRIWKPEIGAWREVSVHGGVHEPRQRPDVAGKRYPDEDSVLTNGTIVDLAGIQLLFESAASMRAHEKASRRQDAFDSPPDRIVARFNARRPQCPVQLHTIRLEYDDEKRKALTPDRRPYIFPACGHVHAFAPELQRVPCPLCRTRGPFVELKLEWEPSICDDEPQVAFNPCGHIVSERVARKWASLALPDNAPPNARYRPICPFCAKPLKVSNGDHPYNRILFQSQGDDDDDDDDDRSRAPDDDAASNATEDLTADGPPKA
ncbi:hypothetical protein CTAYLR_000091 [Chrysophaeum taylorii]|uniref:Uncharacterized protein n=1 Tax=Chrysophaeum taylorii TaxID=2483200 RepID=A0AAD7UGQ1_9STRA|nr:hypothetical protein CTAYLR_000091 [Chrysophaeum taylorii]